MESTKIWISEDWYISVNEEGYVDGPCFEGMLGCVLQITSTKDKVTGKVSTAALKMPRLLADTVEENYYICKLTEDEEAAVRTINSSGAAIEGLVPSQFYGNPPLRKPRGLANSDDPDAVLQDGHVIFVSFERDHKPRFCTVKLKGEAFEVMPKGCQADFVANVTVDKWRSKLSRPHIEGAQPFSKAVYSRKEIEPEEECGPLEGALERGQTNVWYAGLPAIVFLWAGGNLQETITKRKIGYWSLEQHFSLFDQVLRGTRFLHKYELIHGDIRPANVMWIGEPEAVNYKLGDYGSYGREWQLVGNEHSNNGLTMVGPAIGLRRQTAFYSPERRAGKEFESADTAIILEIHEDHAGNQTHNYVVLLGWRSALIENGNVTDAVNQMMLEWGAQAAAADSQDESSEDEPQSGDRLRLRNYLFDIIRSEVRNNVNQKLFLCSGRYAEILHDSLVVYQVDKEINSGTVLDLSNYVEFQQWSAASDLFSVGAVCLYSLFCGGLQKSGGETNGSDLENPDRLFTEMLAILESVEWFRFVWDELETFRQTIEELYNQDPQPPPLDARNHQVIVSLDDGQTETRTLFATAMHATTSILSSTPRAQVLLGAFDYNLGYFLLFMHFALACLHRQSDRSPQKPKVGTKIQTPFAKNRVERPHAVGAADRAFHRLQTIRGYLNQPFFKGFKCTPEEYAKIIKFDPRSDFQIRRNLEKKQEEVQQLLALIAAKEKEISHLDQKYDAQSREIKRLTEEIHVLRLEIKLRGDEIEKLRTETEAHRKAASEVVGLPVFQLRARQRAVKTLVDTILNGGNGSMNSTGPNER